MKEPVLRTVDALKLKKYWRENLILVGVLLSVWFVVAYLGGIVYVNELNRFRFFGFKLGFWIAQQGSIFVFIALIFTYVFLMNRLDKKYGFDEDERDGF